MTQHQAEPDFDFYVAKTFWGKTLKLAAFFVSMPVVIVEHGVRTARGKDLDAPITLSILNAAGRFGDKHADHIEKNIITGTFVATGVVAKSEFEKKKKG
jgi:hypothetical protein